MSEGNRVVFHIYPFIIPFMQCHSIDGRSLAALRYVKWITRKVSWRWVQYYEPDAWNRCHWSKIYGCKYTYVKWRRMSEWMWVWEEIDVRSTILRAARHILPLFVLWYGVCWLICKHVRHGEKKHMSGFEYTPILYYLQIYRVPLLQHLRFNFCIYIHHNS